MEPVIAKLRRISVLRKLPALAEVWKKERHECGSVLIETALAFMLGMTVVLGIVEFCMMSYTYGVFSDAARHGMRYATIHGADSTNCSGPSAGCADATGANVVSDVKTFAGMFLQNVSGATVQVSYPDGSSATPSRVDVTITYTYQPLFHLAGMSHVFNVDAEGRIVY